MAIAELGTRLIGISRHTAVGYGKLDGPVDGPPPHCVDNNSGRRYAIDFLGGFDTGDGLNIDNGSVFASQQKEVGIFCESISGLAGLAQGDSGGPLFNNDGQIIGVFSGWPHRDPDQGFAICWWGQNDPQPRCGSGTIETFQWTNVTESANRDWIVDELRKDFDGDGVVDSEDPWPAHASHLDSDGDGIIDPLDYRPAQYDPFNLRRSSDGPGPHDGEWVAELLMAVF